MANQEQLNILRSGVDPWNAWRNANPKNQVDLAQADLSGLDLNGADLHAANLAGAQLHGAHLAHANLSCANLSSADLTSAELPRANLREADLADAIIRHANFRNADVAGGDLHRVHPDPATIWPPLPWAAKLQYLYLLRVPILLGLGLFFLPILSVTVFRSLLGNLFVLDLWNIFWTMIATLFLAFSILVIYRVVLLNGMGRFDVQQALTEDKVSRRALFVTELLAAPMLIVGVFSNNQSPNVSAALTRLGVAAAAIIVAQIAGYGALLLSVLFSPRYHLPPDQRFPVPFGWMKTLLCRAYDYNWLTAAQRTKIGDLSKTWPLAFRAGYFDRHTGLLFPGQWLSLASLLATYLLYMLLGGLKSAGLGQTLDVPAICYVVLLLLLLNWILGMAAFFLDRFRIPLLLLLGLLVWIGNKTPQSDHYYALQSGNQNPVSPELTLTASARLSADADHPRGRVVLVATEGGGIQAAAWTAQVLTGLQQELHRISTDKPVNFADSIALISSVSGGAVGTMFFVNAYQSGASHSGFSVADPQLSEIVKQAEGPSLADIAWGLAYPDFWRVFFPYTKAEKDRLIDRGMALEQSWSKRGNIHAKLGDWRLGVQEGWRPAVIFNATFVEAGGPFLLATTAMPKSEGRQTFAELAPEFDIQLVTAVRLAATFPYVTPASRELKGHLPLHVVDGGYYDNYGVYSLLEWLREALVSTPQDKRPDILIIQIRSFPSTAAPEAESRGWFYQVWAPLDALLNVRTTAQLVRDNDALAHFLEYWSCQDKTLKISQATFEFSGKHSREHPPLSWQMNDAQITAIGDDWDDQINKKKTDWLKVRCFFRPGDPGCPKPSRDKQ